MVREGVLTRAVLGLSACALTALVYLPFVDNPFVLDDETTVLLNPSLVDVNGARGILLYDRWHPLVAASFTMDRALSGVSPLGFHITNTILHVFVVATLFVLASRRSLASNRRRTGVEPGSNRGQTGARPGSDRGQTTFAVSSTDEQRPWTAFVAAAAFGVNPLTARSVAYISARADLLFAAGVLLALLLAWGAVRAGSRLRFACALAAALAALAAVPWDTRVPHGPYRLYLTTALLLLAGSRWMADVFDRSRVARVVAVLGVAALAFQTGRTLQTWEDPVELWRLEVDRTPDEWAAHLGYADALREASHCPEAVREYEAALRLHAGVEGARRGLAQCR